MKILVAIKTIPELMPQSSVQESAENKPKFVLDPFSEVALEQGLRLLESGQATELVAVTVSPSEQGLRAAMALGCKHALQIPTLTDDCNVIAKLLQQAVEHTKVDLVLLGKQSGDGDNHQVGQRLAGLLNWPQLSAVDQLQLDGNIISGSGLCAGGRGNYQTPLPAVVTADLRLATPRFATLPNLMRARRLPIERLEPAVVSSGSVEVVAQQRHQVVRLGQQLADTQALATVLLQGELA
ncbi:electron transfer flavoprotein subunit beta/FixA family protein [Ferrimonas lipolytica]|uniref:Electron transfer flavoprotein subunit beta/FixA family protein n=1 Tax=Ferrimonas lipolytica TaxID=2724191 RepID=A0A6H1UFG4_9GAMM|nr:electron transfer flavoprotein subunit beta/FixA family protein [Ferrimonas lipolytica]QIZ77369.1 electron transfer flavoprotein subunit beta/FixA family protein [Ferrimonas lipolytica]